MEFGGGGVAVVAVVVVVLSVFVSGGGGPVSFRGCEGGNVLSQLWSLVVVASPSSSVFVLGGGGGPVSFRGCEGGNVLSQLWSLVVVASPSSLSSSSCCLFLFLGGGGPVSFRVCVLLLRGMEASQLPGVGNDHEGDGERVSLRGCDGEGADVFFF